MVELKKDKTRMYGKGIPKVRFENTQTKMAITNIFVTNRDIHEYLGLVLLRLGYQSEDEILIHSYNKNNNYFMCTANKNNTCQMWIDRENSEIVLEKHNYVYGYECIPEDRNEIGMKISLGRYMIKYADGVTFTRYLSRDNAKYVVRVCDNILEIELSRPSDVELRLFDENGKYAKYRLDNEDELIEYLSKEAFTKTLVDVYNDLCENYIGNVSRYSEFCLKYLVTTEDGKEIVTDLIHLKNGILEKFGETSQYDRTVFVDKDDNWSYEMPKEGSLPVDFCISSQNGKVNCIFSFDEEEYDVYKYMQDAINADVEIAMNEVTKTRRRVKEIFGENKGSK